MPSDWTKDFRNGCLRNCLWNRHKIRSVMIDEAQRSNIMRYFIIVFLIVMVILSPQNIKAQQQERIKKISIETEPISFILGGAGVTGLSVW